jgi:hypothetical protein
MTGIELTEVEDILKSFEKMGSLKNEDNLIIINDLQ